MMAITEKDFELTKCQAMSRIWEMAALKGVSSAGLGVLMKNVKAITLADLAGASEYFGVDDMETALWLNAIVGSVRPPKVSVRAAGEVLEDEH